MKNLSQKEKMQHKTNKIQFGNNTSLEYEYDETEQENLNSISDYTNYNDEYDD